MTAAVVVAGAMAALLASGSVWARRRFAAPLENGGRAEVGHVTGYGRLSHFSRPYRLPLVVAVGLTLVAVAIDLALPWPLALVIDHAIGGEPLPPVFDFLGGQSPAGLVWIAAAGSVLLTALSGWTGYLVDYLNGAVQARIGSDLRTATFGRLQNASLAFHDRHGTGDLLTRLSIDVRSVEDMLVSWFETALPETLSLIGIFIIMIIVDPTLALVALAVVPLLALWAVWAHREVRAAEIRARASTSSMLDRASDLLRHVRAIQVFSNQDRGLEAFQTGSDEAADSQLAAVEREARMTPFADVVLAVGAAAILIIGALRVISGNLTVGVLVVMVTYAIQMYAPIERLAMFVMTLARGSASRQRLVELMAAERGVVDRPNAQPAPAGPFVLAAKNVGFSYDGGREVIRRFSFTARPGEVVAIVGSTGAGKSSLLSLLVRLYDPDRGAITLNGRDTRQFTVDSVRDRIAFVPQDMWIFDGSIADNIAFGHPAADGAAILRAGSAALIDEFVDRLSDGYDSVVGEEGVMLSGGQRRRVALARALLRNAPILVLDEPTADLDAHAAEHVWAAIDGIREGRTIVVVTHSLELAHKSDRVYVIEAGSNVESGTPTQLLAKQGRYASLWRQQVSSTSTPADKTALGDVRLQEGR